jgi:hypothetical protein
MAAPSDATRCPRRRVVRPTTPIPSTYLQSANRPVTITEDAQQPSIIKLAQKSGRPTSHWSLRLTA